MTLLAPATATRSELSVRDLTRVFTSPTGETTQALLNTSFTAAPGEFVSIIGPSGWAKALSST